MKKQLIRFSLNLLLLLIAGISGNAQVRFSSLDSVFAYADRNSVSSKISAQQSLLAKWTKVAALANTLNFRDPVSFSATNNMLLPVNFIPAEAFGGPAGTFRQITLGQQYVSNFNFNPQIDLINAQNWARVKSAEYNKELTEVSNSLTRRSLHESLAAAYFNCLAFEEQIGYAEKNAINADSVTAIIKNRYELGIAREQDYNNALVNSLSVKDKLQQLKTGHDQQVNALKILCDIPSNAMVELSGSASPSIAALKPTGTLESKYSYLQGQYMRSELRANRMAMLPVLSLVYYQGWQQNSNASLFDANAKWIQSRYIGFRLSVPFPPDATRFSQNYTAKVNHTVASLNAAHTSLQNELGNRGLELELEKSSTSFRVAEQIAELKSLNYSKSLEQYKAGILATDLLLSAFSDLLNTRLNLASARAAMEYAKSRIAINNSIK